LSRLERDSWNQGWSFEVWFMDQVGDDAHPALVRGLDERAEVLHRAVVGMDLEEVGDVVPPSRSGETYIGSSQMQSIPSHWR
jgi:hypothetical protein